jgi:putative ABC transport system permease protein
LPAFNTFTGKQITLSLTNWVQFIGMALLLATAIGILAGSYPAWYLSGLKPVEILKGGFTAKYNPWFSKPLLVIQFAFSAFLIMSSLVMYQQMRLITTKDLGYNQHQVVSIPMQSGSASVSNTLLENFRASLSRIRSSFNSRYVGFLRRRYHEYRLSAQGRNESGVWLYRRSTLFFHPGHSNIEGKGF